MWGVETWRGVACSTALHCIVYWLLRMPDGALRSAHWPAVHCLGQARGAAAMAACPPALHPPCPALHMQERAVCECQGGQRGAARRGQSVHGVRGLEGFALRCAGSMRPGWSRAAAGGRLHLPLCPLPRDPSLNRGCAPSRLQLRAGHAGRRRLADVVLPDPHPPGSLFRRHLLPAVRRLWPPRLQNRAPPHRTGAPCVVRGAACVGVDVGGGGGGGRRGHVMPASLLHTLCSRRPTDPAAPQVWAEDKDRIQSASRSSMEKLSEMLRPEVCVTRGGGVWQGRPDAGQTQARLACCGVQLEGDAAGRQTVATAPTALSSGL